MVFLSPPDVLTINVAPSRLILLSPAGLGTVARAREPPEEER